MAEKGVQLSVTSAGYNWLQVKVVTKNAIGLQVEKVTTPTCNHTCNRVVTAREPA
nr:MAG TPA: hypothetical protein [Caudoviricetes sp.]